MHKGKSNGPEHTGPDIYMEHWPDGWTDIENKMFYKEKTVINLGPV
jgi:hypothetical protein